MKPGDEYAPPHHVNLKLTRDEGIWLDAMAFPYGTTLHRALAHLFRPLIKEYKTAATYVIAREIEKRADWKAIAMESDDWPSMRTTLKKTGLGEEHWLRLSIFDKQIDCRVLTMLIREKYNGASGHSRAKEKKADKG